MLEASAGSARMDQAMSHTFTISYPDSIPDLLQESPDEFEREARFAMAAKLFETKRLSSGMAATLVGMDRVGFLLQLHRLGVAMIDLDPDELAQDIAHA